MSDITYSLSLGNIYIYDGSIILVSWNVWSIDNFILKLDSFSLEELPNL
jgi:hypothetical protein